MTSPILREEIIGDCRLLADHGPVVRLEFTGMLAEKS